MTWAIVCEAKRGEVERKGVITGRDVYGLTAAAIVQGAVVASRKGFERRGGLAPSRPSSRRASSTGSSASTFAGRSSRPTSRSRSRPSVAREIGLPTRKEPRVTLKEGASPGGARCPACGEPLFVWLETEGYGSIGGPGDRPLRDCGLVAARDAVPSPDHAIDALLLGREENEYRRRAIRAATPPACRPGSERRTGRRCSCPAAWHSPHASGGWPASGPAQDWRFAAFGT